ncbi:MAG: hypothetical protein JJU00_03915 [Opitutales bacterium]|nr:hypothetical protein [Opitutales bacterium]
MTTDTRRRVDDLRRREAVLCMDARDDRSLCDVTRRRWQLNRLRRAIRNAERTANA